MNEQTGLALAIETSNPTAGGTDASGPGVAIGRITGRIVEPLGVEPLRPRARHDDDLMPAIQRLCERLSLRARHLDTVAVSIGPGGYTALRIAAATGKMIAEAAGAACVAVPTALAVARRVRPDVSGAPFAVCLAGKRDSSFVTVFDSGDVRGGATPRGRLMTEVDIAQLDVASVVSHRFLPRRMAAAAERRGIPIVEPCFDPVAVLELSNLLARIDPLELNPMYPREPDAVTQWRNRARAAPTDS